MNLRHLIHHGKRRLRRKLRHQRFQLGLFREIKVMKIVITGVSRGIGLELARAALQAGHEVLAVARQPGASQGLAALQQEHGERLKVLAVELTDAGAAAAIAAAVAGWDAVDLLLNNAGIMRNTDTREDFLDTFAINTIAPFELTQALLPKLQKSAHARVVHVSSRMGSIADNGYGGHYSYRASKAALNMINMSLARDHDWLTAVVVHPGWVKTSLGGPDAPTSVEDSARGVWKVVTGLKPKQSGKFYDFQGNELPW
jgi:NAD(P)-dependent dehydrogenase (short-subunit alcohol dehydrogenase family)